MPALHRDPRLTQPDTLCAFATVLAEGGLHGPLDSNGTGGRFFWVGSSFKKWICILCTEQAFDQALARSCGLKGTTWPWAHAATGSGLWGEALFAAAAFDVGPPPDLLNAFISGAAENLFSHTRFRDSTRFFACEPSQVEAAAAALVRALPGSTPGASLGADMGLFEHRASRMPVFEPNLLALMDPPYFESGRTPPDLTEIQVDGIGRPWALWLLGAARAMGCPAELSVRPRSIRQLLGLGDILSASNKMASDDPQAFEKLFSEAISPIHIKSAPLRQDCRDIFEASDRRSIAAAWTPTASASRPPPRL